MKLSTRPGIQLLFSVTVLLTVSIATDSLNPYVKFSGLGLLTIFVLGWFFLRKNHLPIARIHIALIPWALFNIYHLVTLSSSPIPQVSIERWALSLMLLIVPILILDTLDGGWSERIWLDAVILIVLVVSILELTLATIWYAQAMTISGKSFFSLPIGYRSSGLFIGHANVLSGLLNLVLPITIIRGVSTSRSTSRAGNLALTVIFLLTQYLTSSRGGWLSGAIGITIALGFYFLRHYSIPNLLNIFFHTKKRTLRTLSVLSIIFLLGIIGVTLLIRQIQITPGHAPFVSARSGIWNPALEIIKDRPIIGHGLSSFSILYAQSISSPPGFSTSHAHNIVLQVLVQSGVIGLILSLIIGYLVIKDLVKRALISTQEDIPNNAIYLGAVSAFLVHHIFDYLLESPAYVVTLTLLVSFGVGRSGDTFKQVQYNFARVFVLIILVAGWIPLGTSLQPSLRYSRGVDAFREGDVETAANEICIAADDTQSSFYDFQCGLAIAYQYIEDPDPDYLQEATGYYREGLFLDPTWAIHHANDAAILFELGKSEQAFNRLEFALARAPRHVSLWMNYAHWKALNGQAQEAQQGMVQALKLNPFVSRTFFFTQEPWEHALQIYLDEYSEELSRSTVFNAWQAQETGQFEIAESTFRAFIKSNPSSSLGYRGLSQTLLEKGDLQAAEQTALLSIFINPADPSGYFIRGQILEAEDEWLSAMEMYANGFDSIRSQSESWSYYARTYYRFFPEPDFVPQLIRYFPTQTELSSLCKLSEYYELENQTELKTALEQYLLQLDSSNPCQ